IRSERAPPRVAASSPSSTFRPSSETASQIRASLDTAARSMTTLDVKLGVLHTAVSAYPVVKALHVSAQFPHQMRVDVAEQIPVAVIGAAGGQTEVSADGTLLRGVPATIRLPTISTEVAPGGTRVTGTALGDIRMLAAAPFALLSRVAQASSDRSHGLVAKLRDGPWVYFGAADDLHAKWAAAGAVLADTSSQGAGYIDVSVAARPAAGSGADAASRLTTGDGSQVSTGATNSGN
ncbi:MAG: cell division protein FtsQ/DivIB, partial [Solirubrobacteraceae bacterium]